MSLLGYQNAKTIKGEDLGYTTGILYLAPSDVSGFNTCPKASEGCKKACLFTAGRGKFNNVYTARVNKTLRFFKDRSNFVNELKKDIESARKKADKNKMKLCIRLNGTSDISWEKLTDVIQSFPDIQFYDYTKIKTRVLNNTLKNYHLTFSCSESNWNECIEVLNQGHNVAIVFDSKPKTYQGFKVIDGDSHDLRFLDTKGVIVGLTAKGDAKKDTSGFVHRANENIELKQVA
jgi:hypothetical protein